MVRINITSNKQAPSLNYNATEREQIKTDGEEIYPMFPQNMSELVMFLILRSKYNKNKTSKLKTLTFMSVS